MKKDKEPKHTLSEMNEERAAAAYAGVCGYESHRLERQGFEGRCSGDGWDQEELRDTICDLICDLHHLADQYELDFQHCCETARDHYENETNEHNTRDESAT